ncbi:hypothetical protein ACWKT3_31120 [Streptomyces violaceus]
MPTGPRHQSAYYTSSSTGSTGSDLLRGQQGHDRQHTGLGADEACVLQASALTRHPAGPRDG